MQITGYHRKYAMWLLNQTTEQGQPPVQKARPRNSGAEVRVALVQVWDKANRICAKRLIPFPHCLKNNLCPQTLQKPYPASLRVSVGSSYPFVSSLLAQRPEMGLQ